MIVRRIGPLSCAKIAGVIYAALGLFVGALISIFALLGAALSGTQRISENAMSPLLGAVMGVGAILICPIFYGLIGFLSALIGAWLYNLVAASVGGVEVEIS